MNSKRYWSGLGKHNFKLRIIRDGESTVGLRHFFFHPNPTRERGIAESVAFSGGLDPSLTRRVGICLLEDL